MYRCVKSNSAADVIAIGMDESQGGSDYNDIGIWQTFVFELIPSIPQEVIDWVSANNYMGVLYKVDNGSIVAKTLQEIQA